MRRTFSAKRCNSTIALLAHRSFCAIEIILGSVGNFSDLVQRARFGWREAARRVRALNEADLTEDSGTAGFRHLKFQPFDRSRIGTATGVWNTRRFHSAAALAGPMRTHAVIADLAEVVFLGVQGCFRRH